VDKSTKEIISSISIRKYLKFGQTSKAFIDDFKEIRSTSERVALVIGAAGAINIQSKNYKGTNKIFEINPRFSATCIMRAHVGINEPDLLFRNIILGESAKFRSYKKMVCTRYWEEICV
jgi:carbamoyl-phosphate synthase large subunit